MRISVKKLINSIAAVSAIILVGYGLEVLMVAPVENNTIPFEDFSTLNWVMQLLYIVLVKSICIMAVIDINRETTEN